MKAIVWDKLENDVILKYHQSLLYNDVVLKNYQFTESTISYYQAYFGDEYLNETIIIFENFEPIMVCYAYSKQNCFSFFNDSIAILALKLNAEQAFLAYKTFLIKLDEIIKQKNIKNIKWKSDCFLNAHLLAENTKFKIEQKSIVNLEIDETTIFSRLRKSYKSFVNWGRKNLVLIVINTDNSNEILFNDFRALHIEVAGKQTRSDLTWQIQWDAIKKNEAFLILCYLNDKLVGGSYILLGKQIAYYGVAAYNRELMAEKMPLGHYNIYSAILICKELGLQYFDIGSIFNNNDDTKENDIFYFKKGFANIIEIISNLENNNE